jgi:hypothetical protein
MFATARLQGDGVVDVLDETLRMDGLDGEKVFHRRRGRLEREIEIWKKEVGEGTADERSLSLMFLSGIILFAHISVH